MYALVMVEHTNDTSLWPEELRDINNNTSQFIGATKLVSGSWLIDLETGLSTFGILLGCLLSRPALRYKAAFFEEKPVFVSPPMQSPSGIRQS